MMDFGDGIDSLLRSTPANEVSLHSAYNRQAAKRLVKEYSSKDIRKSIEALSKRVIKHFDDEEITTLAEGLNGASNFYDASGISAEEIIEVLGKVWRSLEDGFTIECERMQRILRECYSNNNDSSKLLCDFTIEDVRRPFASSAPAGRRR
jgi:hemerythrin